MSFIWPAMLLSLLLLPLLVALYRHTLQRRQRLAARYGSLGLAQDSGARNATWKCVAPPALFLLGLAVLAFALARPQAVVSLPRVEGTVILTFDTSGSMGADDMQPTRMEAAKAAAREFIQRQPPTVLVGVVSFSDSGFSIQPPTNDQAAVLAAVDRLAPARGTSLGNGINAALGAIEAMQRREPPHYYTNATAVPSPTATPVPEGTYVPAVIVLLTDGESNVPPDPLIAARAAAERGVRIYPIGIGSATGTTLKVEGFTVHTQLDEAVLRQIADLTNGVYYNAQNEQDLRTVYENVGAHLIVRPQLTEITSIFAGLSLMTLLLGGLLSLLWFSRLP